jgi:Barrel-sandwich domain of CusB or HlyD membrane-fusion/Heavy metal binding domain
MNKLLWKLCRGGCATRLTLQGGCASRLYNSSVCAHCCGPCLLLKGAGAGTKNQVLQSPMHPWITSDKPGNCTICGMALVPIYEGEAAMESKEGLWFHAEVYERDLPDIRLGQKAILRTPTVPGREFEGVVTFIDPNFDPKTRSTKVRIEVDNPPAESDARGLPRVLPHRAYAEADIIARLGEALVVPRSAVLRDGRRSIVYVENSSGEYEQRALKTGRVGDEGIEILEGVKDGERVVAQGNLMIDAEAQCADPPLRRKQ